MTTATNDRWQDVLSGASRWAVVQGDCLAALAAMPSESVDAVVTDPPYSSGGQYRGDRMGSTTDKYVNTTTGNHDHVQFEGDNRDQRGWQFWTTLWLSECYRIAKPGAAIVVFCDWRQLPTLTDAVQGGGWTWRGIVPWNKTEGTRPQKGWFRAQCEYCVVGAKGKPARYDQSGRTDAPAVAGFLTYSVGEKFHQTGKPIELMQDLLQVVVPGGLVLDPFSGSGSTGVAALRTGRRFIGCEMVDEYCRITRERVASAENGGVQGVLLVAPEVVQEGML